MALPPDVRAELTERLIESLAQDISPEITSAQLAEVRRRIAQVESGEVELIPGDEALARVRNLLAQHLPVDVASSEFSRAFQRRDRKSQINLVASATNESLNRRYATTIIHPIFPGLERPG